MEEIAAMGEAIAETAAILDVATHRFLTQLREFDRVDGRFTTQLPLRDIPQ